MCVDHTTRGIGPLNLTSQRLTYFLSSPKQAPRMMVEQNNILSRHAKHNQVTEIKATYIPKSNGGECQASHYQAGKRQANGQVSIIFNY